MSSLQSFFSRAVAALYRCLLLPAVFPIVRFYKDQIFLAELDNPRLRPSVVAGPLYFLWRAKRSLDRTLRRVFSEFALSRYTRYIRTHYGPDGRGYFSYAGLSDDERRALFGKPNGRIEPLLDTHAGLLGLSNGDRILDVGCGRGQNTKVLMERFDRSQIHAVDISAEAVQVVALATEDNPRVTTQVGDITDPSTYAGMDDDSIDHVVMSHVMALIFRKSIAETQQIRQALINSLVRVARKSVIILDDTEIVSGEEEFVIEQLNRGAFAEPIAKYFPADRGTLLTMPVGTSVAVVYLCS